MNELDLVDRLVAMLRPTQAELVIGPGEDDAAAWREASGEFTVATIDTAVEGVHFDLSRQAPSDVGWRALAFALGDLAAKGARPTYGLVSLSIPAGWTEAQWTGIYGGLAQLAAEVGLQLVGGDTTRAPSHGSLTLALLGRTAIQPRPRAAAQPGWLVAVTGPLGGAGLDVGHPLPLLAKGAELAGRGLVCGDISDGLVREMDKVARASGHGARLRLDSIPVAAGSSTGRALASGEEVELVCLGVPNAMDGLVVVGEVTAEPDVVVVDAAGGEVEVGERGYDHFA